MILAIRPQKPPDAAEHGGGVDLLQECLVMIAPHNMRPAALNQSLDKLDSLGRLGSLVDQIADKEKNKRLAWGKMRGSLAQQVLQLVQTPVHIPNENGHLVPAQLYDAMGRGRRLEAVEESLRQG